LNRGKKIICPGVQARYNRNWLSVITTHLLGQQKALVLIRYARNAEKRECQVNWKEMADREVRRNIAGYIEMFYTSGRIHSYNGHLSQNA
jgi:hypothetical protein